MFNILLIANNNNQILRTNIDILLKDDIKCKIYIVNTGKNNLNIIDHNIKILRCDFKQIVEKINGDIAIIMENISINKHFLRTLQSNHDSEILNLFRVDIIRDALLIDNRIGKFILKSNMNYNMSFNTKILKKLYSNPEDLYDYCKLRDIKIKLSLNIRVFKHINNPIVKIKRLPIERPTKIDKVIRSINLNREKDILLNKQLKDIADINGNDNTYSIIIPFMYNGDRFPLFEASIKCLHIYFKDNSKVEIIIHETSSKRYLTNEFIQKYNLKYIYSEWNEVFHRAWALNIPAKYMAIGDVFVFFDADLIVTDEWVNELLKCNSIMIGWGKMMNLTKKSTEYYLKNGEILNNFQRTRIPEPNGAAGGINILPRKVFFDICGWDETFRGTYGGEDNALNLKLQSLGYIKCNTRTITNCFESSVYHLYHNHETTRISTLLDTYKKVRGYSKIDWKNKIKSSNWGDPVEKSLIWNNCFFIDNFILNNMKSSKKPIITICMVSYRRINTLLKTLNRLSTFNISINLLIWVNKYENFTDDQINEIQNICEKLYFYKIIFCDENIGAGKPRNILLKLSKELDTEYVVITDDDMYYNNEDELLIGSSLLTQDYYSEYGSIGLWCHPEPSEIHIKNKELRNYKIRKGFFDVDALGAATMTIRKDIIDDDCNIDPEYFIGWEDFDFSLQIKKKGYKIGLLCDDRWKPINLSPTGDEIYKKDRYNEIEIKKSTNRFISKWNIKPVWKSNIKTYSKKKKILWCKIDTSYRVAGHYDHIIKELTHLCDLTIINKSLDGIHPWEYQLKRKNGEIIPDSVIKNPNDYDAIIISQAFAYNEEWDQIKTPVFMILEDQHNNARYNIQLAIANKWIILNRYKLKDFNDDLNQKIEKSIWFPPSVNIDIFKDYGLEKQYKLLQIGAIYKIYELRNYVKEYFDKNKWDGYRYIKRPNEFKDDKIWPIGIDYAKELNKSYFVLCCGATVKYPVMKYFEIPACKSIIYGDYFDELGDLGYIPNENMIIIDRDNIKEQIEMMISDSTNIEKIKNNGYNLIHDNHTTVIRAKELLNIIENEN